MLEAMEKILFGGVTYFMVAAILVVSIIYLVITIYTNVWSKKLPPGPSGLSGMWQLIQAFRYETIPDLCWEWAEKYGPLTFVSFAGFKFCIVNTADDGRLLMASEKYKGLTSDRLPNFLCQFAMYGGKDIFFAKYDVVTRRKRRLFHKAIALYGDGVEKFEKILFNTKHRLHRGRTDYVQIYPARNSDEDKVISGNAILPVVCGDVDFWHTTVCLWIVGQEVDKLISDLQANAKQGQDVQMDDKLSRILKDILYILMSGERAARPEDVDAIENFDLAMNDLNSGNNQLPLTAFPWLRFFPGRFKDVCQRILDTRPKAEEVMFAKFKDTFDENNMRGVTDVLIQHITEPGYEFLKDEDHIKAIVLQIFFAAHLTSRSTLLNSFLVLLHHPDVAKNIQDEVDRVLGDRKPHIEDRLIMPYTEAFILEILRYHTQVPLNCFRNVSEDLYLEDCVIPKNSQIILNTNNIHHDPTFWDDPWKFKPERFLDESGQILPADGPVRKNLVSFGLGNRVCPGETFARSRVFLILTRFLQEFDLLPPATERLKSCHPKDNLMSYIKQPPSYRCQIKAREKKGLLGLGGAHRNN